MRTRLILPILCGIAVPLAAQEAVTLRLGGSVGAVNHYQGTVETFIRGGPMAAMMSGDTTLPFNRITTHTTRTLTSSSGDTLVFREVIDSARFEAPAMPQMAAMGGNIAGMMQGQTTLTRMDSRGRYYGAEVTGGMSQMAPGGMGGQGRGRGGMGGGNNRQQRAVFLLPAGPVRVGDTWSDSTTWSEGDASTNFLATFRLERVGNRGSNRIAVVSVNGTMASSAPQGSMQMSVTGEFQLDVTGRRLVDMTMNMAGTMNSQMGDMPMRISIRQQLVP